MRLRFRPWGWDLGLEVGIWASRQGFGPQGWDMGLEAEIWAWRLGEGGTKKEEKEKEEKIPHMCESIGHRPLWGRCPKRKKTSPTGLRYLLTRPERLYWVLVLGLQYSGVLGFPNTGSLFCYFSNTI